MEDEEIAKELADSMTAIELREFMSEHGVSRSRGASKLMMARRVVEEEREMIIDKLDLGEPGATVCCACGYEEHFDSIPDAKEAAQKHTIQDADCHAKAWHDKMGHMIYGELGA